MSKKRYIHRSGIMGWGTPTPLKKCFATGKTVFDKRGAQTAMNKRFEEEHVRLRIYECPNCKGWHLTSRI